jgi:hypothetical protein
MHVRITLAAIAAALFFLPGSADAALFQRLKNRGNNAAGTTTVDPQADATAGSSPRHFRGYHRNVCWPAPFLAPDRMAVRAPFAVMIDNGWRLQNTLSDEHFDGETGMLNDAGKLKVRDILTYSPPEHRTVFVLQAHYDQLTDARRRAVSDFVSSLNAISESPLVADTNIPPRGWPADNVSAITTRFNATMPDPRLPPPMMGMGGTGGSGSGGGSSGGGGGGY